MADIDIEKSVNDTPPSPEVDFYTQVRRGTIFEENGLYGIRDIDGSIVVWPKFIFIGRCIDDVWMLKQMDTTGIWRFIKIAWATSGLKNGLTL